LFLLLSFGNTIKWNTRTQIVLG